MLPLLIILDDWEGRIAASTCWKKLQDIVEVKIFKEHFEKIPVDDLARAEFLMALRERTTLNEQVLREIGSV